MKSVWKYVLPVSDVAYVDVPNGSEILTVQVQREQPCVWALVDVSETRMVRRCFMMFATGQPIPDRFDGTYVGTYQLESLSLVFHVFEL